MKHFFLVADWGAHNYLTVPNIMMSAGSIATANGKQWNMSRTRLPDGYPDRLILDSGGYSFFSRWGEYPFSIEKYVDLANTLKDKYPLYRVATLDYPCEPDIDRSHLMTNEERIKKTVSNAVECIDVDRRLPWLPIIQGYTLDEYLHCVDLYQEAGIISDYWAVGSLCSRKGNIQRIKYLITKLKELALSNVKVHAFGLNIPYIKDPQIFHALYSSDSAAWTFNYEWGISKGLDIREVKQQAIINYWTQIVDILESFKGQTKLTEFEKCLSTRRIGKDENESIGSV